MATGFPFRVGILRRSGEGVAVWVSTAADVSSTGPANSVDNPGPVGTFTPSPRGVPTRRLGTYALVAVLVVVAVVAGSLAYDRSLDNHPSPSNGSTVLAPVGWASVSLPYGQYADITFITHAPENLTGSFLTENTITAYVMTWAQFQTLVTNNFVSGYEWTSGQVWHGNISYTLSPGDWDLVFLNTNPYGSSGISITQAVVISPIPS
ncbi:MAG TPA: hypothetical protein VMF04_03895 [Thermoplasmata archaeon]|nr:hypothetical protein [Thermoplasmata archaeon]